MGLEGHVRESANGLGRRVTPQEHQQKLAEAAAKAAADARANREQLTEKHVRGSE